MKPLRKRMLEDMQLKGYAPATQAAYSYAVSRLAKHYHKSPDAITEEELRRYLLSLQKEAAHRTFQIALAGIKFFFDGQTEDPTAAHRRWTGRGSCPAQMVSRSMPTQAQIGAELDVNGELLKLGWNTSSV